MPRPKPDVPKVDLHIYVSEETADRLRRAALVRGQAMTVFVERAILVAVESVEASIGE